MTTHKAAPAEVTGVEIAIGTTLPESMELHPLEVPDMEYRYVMVDGRTALVDPGTRKIVHIIE